MIVLEVEDVRRTAVLVGACCLLTACGTRGAAPQTAPDPPSSVRSISPQSPQAVTLRAVDTLLRSVGTPAGSRTATVDEAAGLTPISTTVAHEFVDHHTAYAVPLSVNDALAWFRAHPPPRTKQSGSSSMSDGTTTTSGLTFEAPPGADYVGLEAQINISPAGADSSLVRIDAQATWLSRRGPQDLVPLTETSVDVVLHDAARHIMRATLTGPVVADLARVVNHLRPVAGGTYNCPNDDGAHDVLVFHGRGPDRTVEAATSGCAFVAIRVNGARREPALWGGVTVDRAVRHALAAR